MRADRGWLRVLRIAAVLIGLPVLVYWASREQALNLRQGLHPLLLLGIGLSLVAAALFALRFRIMLVTVQIRLGFVDTLRMTLLSMFYYFFVPLAVGGDVTRFVKLKARDYGAMPVAAAIVLDHAAGFAGLMLLSAGVFTFERPLDVTLDTRTVAAVVALAGLIGALLFLRLRDHPTIRLRVLYDYALAHWRRFAAALVLSLVVHTLFAAAVFAGGRGWGIEITFPELLFVITTALMFQALPLNVAGVGAAEVAGTGLYVAIGLPLSAAVLLSSLPVIYRLIAGIIGGAWDLLPHPVPPTAGGA